MKGLNSALDSLTEHASRMLEPSDREAVCGDLAECGVSGLRALSDLMGLAVRRHLECLRELRTWMLLTLVSLPLGLSLCVTSARIADESAIYLWLYTDNLNIGLVQLPAYWHGMAYFLPGALLHCSVIASLSFGVGSLMAVVARRAIWFSGGALFAILFVTGIVGVPARIKSIFAVELARDYFGNDAVFWLGTIARIGGWISPG